MKQKISRSFGRKAPAYDHHAGLQEKVAAHLASLLPSEIGLDILEIGCGTGFLTRHILNKYPHGQFHITDIAPQMLERCAQKFPACENLRYALMDGENPSTKKYYDLIVTSMTIQWFANPQESLQSLRKLLKPGGQLFFATLGHQSFPEWHDISRETEISNGFLTPPEWPGVLDETYIQEIYENGLGFLNHLKAIGAHQSAPHYRPLPMGPFKKLINAFDEKYKGQVTWHIVYGQLNS